MVTVLVELSHPRVSANNSLGALVSVPRLSSGPYDEPQVSSVPGYLTVGSGRQFGLRKTVGNPLDVFLVLERLPSEVLTEGVFWIPYTSVGTRPAKLIIPSKNRGHRCGFTTLRTC